MSLVDELMGLLQVVKTVLESEQGAIVPTLVVWAAVFALLATGWTL